MSTNVPANDEPNFLIGTAGWLLCWSIKSEAGNICNKLIYVIPLFMNKTLLKWVQCCLIGNTDVCTKC